MSAVEETRSPAPEQLETSSIKTAMNRKYRRQNREQANKKRRENYHKNKADAGIVSKPFVREVSQKELEMPPFREAFPKPEDLNDEGCRALGNAIIINAAMEYYDICERTDSYALRKLDEFIESTWFNDLTDIPWRKFKSIIKAHKKAGNLPHLIKPRGAFSKKETQT